MPENGGPENDGLARDGHARDGLARDGLARDGLGRDGPGHDGPRRDWPGRQSAVTGGAPALAVRTARLRCVLVPLRFTLGTSAATIRTVPLLLLDLETAEGVTGRAYVFCYTPAGARAIAAVAGEAADAIRGLAAAPADLARLLARRYALLGVAGPVRMALSLLDMALWDALAIAAGLPLATLLGAAPRGIAAYDSRGLGLMAPDRLAGEAEALMALGLPALKLRLGHATAAEDLAAVRAVRAVLAPEVRLMVDYNQALGEAEALARGRMLDAEGLAWIEEPIRHDDLAGAARLAAALATPLQLGENLAGPDAAAEALRLRAADLLMPDVARIGGVTGWMRTAALAAAAGVGVSSHLMPEVSAHLLAATPGADWLEYVDWADAILAEPLAIRDGRVWPSDRPGSGIVWDEARIAALETI